MAHGTHNEVTSEKSKSIVSFKSSFWLVVILVGLFIAALNFVKIMGGEHEGGEAHNKTEHFEGQGDKPAHAASPEAEAAREAKQPKEAARPETQTPAPAPEHK